MPRRWRLTQQRPYKEFEDRRGERPSCSWIVLRHRYGDSSVILVKIGLSENFQDMNLRLISSDHNWKPILMAISSLSQGQQRRL